MASNTRYPSWEPHEEVLDTPGLPELQGGGGGGGEERGVGGLEKKRRDQIYLYITEIPSVNAQSGSKQTEQSTRGSEGRRVGEGVKGKGEEGGGADTRRADFSQISLHLCDKKGNNSFR